MKDLLLLTHRIPWPPDKGDKIRSYHFFRHLAQRHRVHLGTFVDSAADWPHVAELERRCASVCVRPAGRLRKLTHGVGALLRGSAVTMDYYRDRRLRAWVARLIRERGPQTALLFSAGMAAYRSLLPDGMHTVLDMVDVDSEKWREYAGLRRWPTDRIYRREARLLAADEARLVGRFDRTLLVSAAEAAILRQRSGAAGERVAVVPNGVDHEYFRPSSDHADPFPAGALPIVFTGAMDYWANVEGVVWFAREILPAVRAREPQAQFYVVGSRPTAEVQALAGLPGVSVTGRVADVRPWLAHARVAVAPLRVARGLQNKVLEAMAMALPVIVTPAALRGIDREGDGVAAAATADEFADAVLAHLDRGAIAANRKYVVERFSWPAALAALDRELAGAATPAVAVAHA